MKNELSQYRENEQDKSPTSYLKILVFNIGSLYLALPIQSVKKIASQFEIADTELNYIDVAKVDGKYIIVIDLHKKLFKSKLKSESNIKKYLLVSQNSAGEEFAIEIERNPPVLQQVELDRVRTLPESYLDTNVLKVASHVTIIPQETKSITVLILDPDRLLPVLPN